MIEQDGVGIDESLEPDTVEVESPVEDGASAEKSVGTQVPAVEVADPAAPSDAAPSPSSAMDDLRHAVGNLDSRLEESQRLLARQTDLVDRLHAENGELRAGELRGAQLPLVRDLLRLHDDVGRMRAAAGEKDHDLRIIQESLVDILARNGIQPFAPEPGESFDPLVHTASGVEPTEEKELDKAVVEVTRQGFRWESGGTIRVAEVRAYRYRGPSQ
jgi:molecular chaperone GrpE (heat shock protein)